MKTALLLEQTRIRFPRLDAGQIRIRPIEKGGSDRKFYRIVCPQHQALILVKYNLQREENRHYVEIAQFLESRGIRVPKIYFHDPAEGLIWIEDLGERDLYSYRRDSWLVRRALYESALEEIAKLHRLPLSEAESIRPSLAVEFNAALYQWEQNYFFENCLGRLFRIDKRTLETLAALPALAEIAERLGALERNLIHRDFQSQNIIVRNGQAYLIDFQGMRTGLAQYDLASLLYDPYVQLRRTERAELLQYYCGGQPTGDFSETIRLCAMQRLMQALGAYGFLGLVKGHRHFLKFVPAALQSLRRILAEIEGTADLAQTLEKLPKRIPEPLA